MSSEEQVREVAERIARRLAANAEEPDATLKSVGDGEDVRHEIAMLRHELTKAYHRLEKLEAHLTHSKRSSDLNQAVHEPRRRAADNEAPGQHQPSQLNGAEAATAAVRSPWLASGVYVPAAHPSGEKFGVGEAVSELVDYFEQERICELEPGGKPCDHCAMCSARGF